MPRSVSLLIFCICFFAVSVFAQHETPPTSAQGRSQEIVGLLKEQANARRAFYEEQAKSRSEVRARQAKEKQTLVEQHRGARAEFGKEKHSPEERGVFFKAQRAEMAALVAKHKEENLALKAELNKRLDQFHKDQRQAYQELQSNQKAEMKN